MRSWRAHRLRLRGYSPGHVVRTFRPFSGNEHGGPHLDAPVHFGAGKWTTDQIPLDRLIGSAVVVDVSAASAANADYQVSVADFTRWEATHGAIEPDTIVLIRTAFAKRWPDARSYL